MGNSQTVGGCIQELNMGIEYLEEGYQVHFEGLGEKRHLFITVFDEDGNVILE